MAKTAQGRGAWKWRLAKWLGVSLLIVVVLAGTLFWQLVVKFYPSAPQADHPEPASISEARAQDLDYFKHYFDLEKSWPDGALDAARIRLADLERRAPDLSAAAFDLEVGAVVALANNGHSNVFASVRSRRFGRVDIRTHWFDGGLYVLRTTQDNRELLGLELVAVNDMPIDEYVEAFARYYGGTEQFKRDMSAYFIEAPELLAGAGFPIEGKSATYTFQGEDGAQLEKLLVAPPSDANGVRALSHEWMYSGPKPGEPDGWISAYQADDIEKPIYLRRDQQAFIRESLPELDAYYIGLRQNESSQTQELGHFLKETLTDIETASPRYIILDVRHNGGGDYTTTSKFARRLSDLVRGDGRIFLISGAQTFSAGMSTMGFVKQRAPGKVTIVGQEPGDRMQFWSEGQTMELPNSKILFRYSTGYVDMQGPCNDYSKCFWIGALYPIEVGSLSPDVKVTTSFADYIAGVDPVMAWIRSQIEG